MQFGRISNCTSLIFALQGCRLIVRQDLHQSLYVRRFCDNFHNFAKFENLKEAKNFVIIGRTPI